MSITPRCNVAGPLGQPIRTRSLTFSTLFSVFAQLRTLLGRT
jgi:hypothetical protein